MRHNYNMSDDFDDWFLNTTPPPKPPLFQASYESLMKQMDLYLPSVSTVYRLEMVS